MSKKSKNLILGLVIVFISLVAILFQNNSPKNIKFNDKNNSPSLSVYEKEVQSASIYPSPEISQVDLITKELEEEALNENLEIKNNSYRVVKVVDGDTLDVVINDKVERLRLIGIDTPETVDPRKSVQCFGIEASNKAKELLNGKFVSLESDETQGDRDKYKRLLRYVILPDGTNFNLFMIAEGFANEYTYDQAYKFQTEFKNAEIEARNNQKGLWSPQTCSGNK